MIGSSGINNLSRAAGDESLQHLQRVNKDGHEEQEKGGRGRGDKKSDSEKGQASDSYERTAEDINQGSQTQVPSPPVASRQHSTDPTLDHIAHNTALIVAFDVELGEGRSFEYRDPGLSGFCVDYNFILHGSPADEGDGRKARPVPVRVRVPASTMVGDRLRPSPSTLASRIGIPRGSFIKLLDQ